MPLTMIVLGFGLVLAGIWFAVGGLGGAAAQGSALKGISVSGPSWLILVALGVAVIMGGGYLYKEDAQSDPPADTLPVVIEPVVTEPFEPFTYGDDVFLDELWDSCADTVWADCDTLYQQSPEGSEYELFGATCGGLIADDGLFCVDADLTEFEKLPNSD